MSLPTSRRPIAPRAWLVSAAQRAATLPSIWANRTFTRRSFALALLGAAVLGAGVASQDVRTRAYPAIEPPTVSSVYGDARSLLSPGASAQSPPAAAAAARASDSVLAGLAEPGYALSNAASAALQDVRVTVADASLLQQLRSQILAPAPPTTISTAALSDLATLVRQAQIVSAAASAAAAQATADPVQLAQAETSVRSAQQQVLDATRARDEAAAGQPAPAAVVPTSAAALSPTTGAALPASTPANPALINDARKRLADAQQNLEVLLKVPPAAAVNAARKALEDALAATPAAPTDDQIAAAKASVDRFQKAYDAVMQGPSEAVVASARASAEGRPTPATAGARPSSAAVPVADPGEKAQDTLNRVVHGPDPQLVADSQANLDSAKAALAALQQQAAYAKNPESQPAVMEARSKLNALLAPPDSKAVADAQAVLAATQGQLNSLVGTPAPAINTAAPITVAPAAVNTATAVAAAATPAASAAAPAAASSPSETPADPVEAAKQRLSDAQKQLQQLVAPGSDPAAGSASVPPAGSTTTQVTPEIAAAQNALPSGALIGRSDLSAVEVELRARYVLSAALSGIHLHPSALSSPLTAVLRSGNAGPSRSLTWPVRGPITQPYGVPELGTGGPHTGVDIGVGIGTPVLASANGIVKYAGGDPSTSYGYYAIVDHGGGVTTLYGHLALPPFLHPGQFIAQGGLIGLSGSTGFSTGPHVHFEVALNGATVDPLRVLPSNPGS
jgi:murein DD-endopeptidase MepM/ murein hydrolase activator NlpD